ncbi:hypothetical protein A2642_04525 [Candidatus Nomurabacteria bacterium RIFCSPHIGHO2_01_FULL_39_10]|uniref:Uncharacterized protein n=1 Tax=Candidatus Nomurabacteria bacterium RIFCSPHIGHO2_01_FULL_39_10 TaxID=1801733 RepID=A0A1F6V7X7_9BACT|nr:MAG: hypothetical protein A2642_04525 [Candidatus Nomurabacteria bacterium RIFCSPHIGHO2_01_FULL_39_10]
MTFSRFGIDLFNTLARRAQAPRFSLDEKVRIVQEIFNGKVPTYLWYNAGDAKGINGRDRASILECTGAPGDFGCLELHASNYVSGFGLRVRGATHVVSSVDMDGKQAELYLANSQNMGPSPLRDIRVNFPEGFVYAPIYKQNFVESLGLRYEETQFS